MYYNARWLRSVPEAQRKGYDPSLGRFAQADTVVQGDNRKSNNTIAGVAETQYVPLTVQYSGEPAILNKLNADNAFLLSKGGLHNLSREDRQKAKIAGVPLETQVLDRYSYSLNNPIKYNDPTGYDMSGGDEYFGYYLQTDTNTLFLWIDGQIAIFDVQELKQDAASWLAAQDFIAAVKSYDTNKRGRDIAAWSALGAGIAGILGCIPTATLGCWGGAIVAVTALKVEAMFVKDIDAQILIGRKNWHNLVGKKRNNGLIDVKDKKYTPGP